MSEPRTIFFPDDSQADGSFPNCDVEGIPLTQCCTLYSCTPENSSSCLTLIKPPELLPKSAKRTKRSRNSRRNSKSPADDNFKGIPSLSAKKNRRIFPNLNSPLSRTGSDVIMGTGITPPKSRFALYTREISEISRSSSLFSEESFSANKGPMIYATEFIEQERLGHGAFGRVVKALKRTDGMVYAVKISWTPIRGERDQEMRSREVHALARCNHPNIIRYFSSWIEDSLLYLQTEYCAGGSISRKPTDFWSQENTLQLLRQISSALNYLHCRNMAHMDVKGENIYITNENIYKLGDFGLVASFDDSQSQMELGGFARNRSFVLSQDSCASQEEGDRKYISWEILNDKSNLPAADIFALGISAYELCSGVELPGYGEQWHRLRHGHLDPLPQLSEDVSNLIKQMMAFEPSERPSASEVEEICTRLM